MAFQRATWHSGLTYKQVCRSCQTEVIYDDFALATMLLPDGEYDITVKDGIITFFVPGTNGEADIYEYLVTKDADVSGLHAVDPSTLEN